MYPDMACPGIPQLTSRVGVKITTIHNEGCCYGGGTPFTEHIIVLTSISGTWGIVLWVANSNLQSTRCPKVANCIRLKLMCSTAVWFCKRGWKTCFYTTEEHLALFSLFHSANSLQGSHARTVLKYPKNCLLHSLLRFFLCFGGFQTPAMVPVKTATMATSDIHISEGTASAWDCSRNICTCKRPTLLLTYCLTQSIIIPYCTFLWKE